MKILILGGNERVISLIDALRGSQNIEIVGVCDTDRNSAGMQYAQRLGISASIQLADFIIGKKLDIVVETSGSEAFQKILRQIAGKEIAVIDSKPAELLLNIAAEKEKVKRYDQLYLVDKLSNIFAAEYDTYNVSRYIFDVLKTRFKIDMEAMFVFYNERNELIITSDLLINKEAQEQLVDYLEKECLAKLEKKTNRKDINIVTQGLNKDKKEISRLKSFISVPLLTKTRDEGFFILGSSHEKAFAPEDIIILNILGDELGLFIENDMIKKHLADAKNKFESMLQSMSEGVIALNTSKEVILANNAAKNVLGLREIKIGLPLWEITNEKDLLNLCADIREDREYLSREIKIICIDTIKTIKVYVTVIKDNIGRHAGWIMLFADITKEKEVDRMKSEFISTTSHELRTPLTAIKESVMLILEGAAGDVNDSQKKFLGIAKRNISRLTDLISDLLDLSKIETGKVKIEKSFVKMEEIITEALSPLNILAKGKSVKLGYEISEDVEVIQCDTQKMVQVFINLVSNAIKYTPEGGDIMVSVKVLKALEEIPDSVRDGKYQEGKDKFILVNVKDSGIGIDKKDFPKLFKKFGQLDSSLTRKPGGTGLGLAICKELIGMHGGFIWVESEQGKGSEFKFVIPME